MLGIDKYYGDYRELLKDGRIQSVHICSPNYLHYEMAKAALEAGKHVICEKPLAISAAEAEELVELADKQGLVNVVNFNIRYYPLMRQLRLMVDKGDMGEVFAVQGSYLQDWLFHPTDYNWRLEPGQSGQSRAIADIGSHWMDLIEFVTGLKIQEVCADFATFHKVRKKPLKPVETYAGKVLKFVFSQTKIVPDPNSPEGKTIRNDRVSFAEGPLRISVPSFARDIACKITPTQ